MKKILFVFGTRPEAIKIAPVYKQLLKCFDPQNVRLCVTGQHKEMLDQVLNIFDLTPHYSLMLMEANQSLEGLTSKILVNVTKVLSEWEPDIVMVHGDTTTCLAAALSAFYRKINVGHIEAGLRTDNIYSPWPEEMNRRLVSNIATYHFCPTSSAKNNLLSEGINESNIFVTGNTVIDSLLSIINKINSENALKKSLENNFQFIDFRKKTILVTGHRRENFGHGLQEICRSLLELSKDENIEIIYPVHMNPIVKRTVNALISSKSNIHLLEPLDYISFIYLMSSVDIILTDSGGIQEEAPSLGKPVLVMRDTTERPEGIEAGTVILVGTNKETICSNTLTLLNNNNFYISMANKKNPYGDGLASSRICNVLKGTKVDEFNC